MTKVAAIQMVSTRDIQQNLDAAQRLIAEAVADGATLILLPENFSVMGLSDAERFATAETLGQGKIQDFLSFTAKTAKIFLIAGSIGLKTSHTHKVTQSCLVYNPEGKCIAHYAKIHLFDVNVEDGTKEYRESNTTVPGSEIVVVPTPIGKLGLSICYDVRFPEQYRDLLQQGAEILLIPSAFTKVTGLAHWEILLRARAIENLSFVIAAAQGGTHDSGRETFGHSMIISPWGEILAEAELGEAVVIADIDLESLHRRRRDFPAVDAALKMMNKI